MFKFEIGDTVYKPKGYNFIGKVVSRYEVEGGNRYDVQVDASIFDPVIDRLLQEDFSGELNTAIGLMAMNCHGMIHIFSEGQLEAFNYEQIR